MKNQDVVKVLENSLDDLTISYKSFIQDGYFKKSIETLRLIKDAMKIIDEFSDEKQKIPETQNININTVVVRADDPNELVDALKRMSPLNPGNIVR